MGSCGIINSNDLHIAAGFDVLASILTEYKIQSDIIAWEFHDFSWYSNSCEVLQYYAAKRHKFMIFFSLFFATWFFDQVSES